MQKVAAVTGSKGFIGSHLTKTLINEGWEVRVVDLPEQDIRDTEALKKVFRGVNHVFHLAAQPRVQESIDKPAETHDSNVNGTLSVLIAARDMGVKRVIFSSSAAVYGDQKHMPLQEDMSATPKSPYGLHKQVGELYGRLFAELYGLPTVSLRYFNVYGSGIDPRGPYALAIGKFLQRRREGKPLTITGDGRQTRDFVHVSDVVRANIVAAKSKKVGKGEVINIGSGRKTSINEIARLIGGPKKYIKPRLEPRHSLADITRAKKLLGWEPLVSLKEGITELKKSAGLI